jgi:hypothetical protein
LAAPSRQMLAGTFSPGATKPSAAASKCRLRSERTLQSWVAKLMMLDLGVFMALREFGMFSDPDLGDEQVLHPHILPARDIKNGQTPVFCAAARRLV